MVAALGMLHELSGGPLVRGRAPPSALARWHDPDSIA